MVKASSSEIASCGRSNVGIVRADNQDAIQVCEPNYHPVADRGYLYALADGMGGYEHGGLASTLALKVFFQTFYASSPWKLLPKLRQGAMDANSRVYQTAQQMDVRMGTTLTAVNIAGNRLSIAHVGDTRAYLVRHRHAACLTNDHTVVGDLVRMHVLSPDKVRTHDQRSLLNRCLGLGLFVQPDVVQADIQQGDVAILCSDGVWSVIEDDEFARMTAQMPNPEALSQTLINLAIDRKSDDNVSVVVIQVRTLVMQPETKEPQRSWRLPRLFGNGILSRLVTSP